MVVAPGVRKILEKGELKGGGGAWMLQQLQKALMAQLAGFVAHMGTGFGRQINQKEP